MKAKRVFTGSIETEDQLRKFLSLVDRPDFPAPLSAWVGDEDMLAVMTAGRFGPGQRYEGSQALDDTGGFFEIVGESVYLTSKAFWCISF